MARCLLSTVLGSLAGARAEAQSIVVYGCNGHPSIVAWGMCDVGQCEVPSPNSGFLKIAAGDSHSLGLRPGGVIAVWGSNEYGQVYAPEPNSGFVAMSAGLLHSLAIRSGRLDRVLGRRHQPR